MTRNRIVGTTRPIVPLAAAALLLLSAVGCDRSKLETGYQYRPLGASDAQRKAYYAPEYSREATMAAQEPAAADVTRRRPGTGGY